VAAAGRAQAGDAFQAAVDSEAAAYWTTVFRHARDEETGWLIVHAGRAAVPYLLRLGERGTALTLLEQVLIRDRSPSTITALLPVLRQIADAAKGGDDEIPAGVILARALARIDPGAYERQGQPTDPIDLRNTQDHLEQALHQPGIRQFAEPDTTATPGTLARVALTHLASQDDETSELIEHVLTHTTLPAEREPVTLAVGALVLCAFRTEIKLHRDPAKGWTSDLHTKPLSNTALGRILSQLLGAFGKH